MSAHRNPIGYIELWFSLKHPLFNKGEAPDPDEGKDPAAVALARKGGFEGR